MPSNNDYKKALDAVIKKSRVHLYKPIQIAEILYHNRAVGRINLLELESYRNTSKRWRDEVTVRLIGRRSTSSARFQDNLFEANAVPPLILAKLGKINQSKKGLVEAYIYKSLQARLSTVYSIWRYIKTSNADSFSLTELVGLFTSQPGLRRSVDKIYEISVYALFSAIVKALKAQITVEILNEDKAILKDFESFIKMVLGIDTTQTKVVMSAALYRVGVTNAADRGLDMWSNFGAAIQIKHLTLTAELVEDIADNLMADKIAIVCIDSEKEAIKTLLSQVGWADRIQGIITINDLNHWYQLCLSKQYRKTLGGTLLADLLKAFESEFPSSEQIDPFMKERGYDKLPLISGWEIES